MAMTHLPIIAAIFGKESMPTCWTPNELATYMIEQALTDLGDAFNLTVRDLAVAKALINVLKDDIDLLNEALDETIDERDALRSQLNAKSEALEGALVSEQEAWLEADDALDRMAEAEVERNEIIADGADQIAELLDRIDELKEIASI